MPTTTHHSPSGYTAFTAKPFVGYVSSDESVKITEENGRLICKQSQGATMAMVVALLLILASAGFAARSPDMARMIHTFQTAGIPEKLGLGFFALLMVAMAVAVIGFILKNLLVKTRIVVEGDGSLYLYRGNLDQAKIIIPAGNIDTLRLETVSFYGKYRTYHNTILILQPKTAEPIVLCASIDKSIAAGFGQSIAQRAGISLHDNTAS